MCVFHFVVFRFSVRQIVYEKCHHPFVLRMDYAFQTEHHAIIVLNLVTTGNIQDIITLIKVNGMAQA